MSESKASSFKDKRILTIQDISCVGQCSLTVALPVISACGVETCILPSAVLSTHTGGFTGYTFRDLTDDMPSIANHWAKEGISFDAVYTGYLGSEKQIEYTADIMDRLLGKGGVKIVDPVMADNGKLYSGFNSSFVKAMMRLCSKADVILPNMTEACLMTGEQYRTSGYSGYDEAYIMRLLEKLGALGVRTVILTGVSYSDDKLGVAVYDSVLKTVEYYFHDRVAAQCHGTGDLFSSVLCGAIMRGRSIIEAAKIAADVTLEAIKLTVDDSSHWYGVRFEKALPMLIKRLET